MLYEEWLNTSMEFLQTTAVEVALKFLAVLVVFIVGWFVAVGVGRLITDILKRLRFNQVFERGGWKQALERADLQVDPAAFVGAIFKWVLFIVVLLAIADILALDAFSVFLRDVLAYLPNVLVAAFIFVAAVIIADIAEKIVRAAVEGAQVGYGNVVSAIVRWSIWVFAILIILNQLRIGGIIPETIVIGIIAFFVIAGGLAFGLGGREMAGQLLADVRRKFKP